MCPTDDTDDVAGIDADGVGNATTVRHSRNEAEKPSMMVVEAVAAATDRDSTDLPPLQRSVDPDALDTMLTRGEETPVRVAFTYADTNVSVRVDGQIEIRVE